MSFRRLGRPHIHVDYVFLVAFRFKARYAPNPTACNKCRVGLTSEGDTWCTGCSSLELAQGLLKQRWHSRGVRQIVEETLLSCARLCRAFSNLDRSLASDAGGPPPGISAKSQPSRPRSRSAAREERPPCPGDLQEDLPVLKGGVHQRKVNYPGSLSLQQSRKRLIVSIETKEVHVELSAQIVENESITLGAGVIVHHLNQSTHRGVRRPRPKRKKKNNKKATRRGGTKHQRHYREAGNLSGDTLSLASRRV